jgi:predicted NAD/FAD-dependent oxidoreductase
MQGGDSMKTPVADLASALSQKDPTTTMRIGVITEIDTTLAGKVRTDQTGTAWIARSEDARLEVDDRVWMLQQNGVFIVGGRLSGSPGRPFVKRKATTQMATSSITAVNDTDLWCVLGPGIYRAQLWVHYSSPSESSDIRSQWDFTGDYTSGGRSCFGPGQITTAVAGTAAASVLRASGHGATTAVIYGTDAGLTTGVLHEDLLLEVDTVGTLNWKWAQGFSNVNTTTVSVASRLYITPVEQIT